MFGSWVGDGKYGKFFDTGCIDFWKGSMDIKRQGAFSNMVLGVWPLTGARRIAGFFFCRYLNKC